MHLLLLSSGLLFAATSAPSPAQELLDVEWARKTLAANGPCGAPKGDLSGTYPEHAEMAAKEWAGYGARAMRERKAETAVDRYERARHPRLREYRALRAGMQQ
ncbi:MAG: hypothetical protein ACKVPX_04055 [Myxococcaceae bacterium]